MPRLLLQGLICFNRFSAGQSPCLFNQTFDRIYKLTFTFKMMNSLPLNRSHWPKWMSKYKWKHLATRNMCGNWHWLAGVLQWLPKMLESCNDVLQAGQDVVLMHKQQQLLYKLQKLENTLGRVGTDLKVGKHTKTLDLIFNGKGNPSDGKGKLHTSYFIHPELWESLKVN